MSSYGGAAVLRKPENGNWLFSQFQQACSSVLQKPSTRRGPFIISDEDLKTNLPEHAGTDSRTE